VETPDASHSGMYATAKVQQPMLDNIRILRPVDAVTSGSLPTYT
jgi:hypothetical protein